MRVCIIGLGHVGLSLAVRAAEVGHYVVGIDHDRRRISSLHAGCGVRDVSDDRLEAVLQSVHLQVCHEVLLSHRDFDVAVVTPLRDGDLDLSYVTDAAEALGRIMLPGCTVVLESTPTRPGTAEDIFRETLQEYFRETMEEHSNLSAGRDFQLEFSFSPERQDGRVSVGVAR